MLPDLPSLKCDIQQMLKRYLQTQVNARLGILGQSPKHTVHEGNRMRTVRADGSTDESELKQASAEMSLKFNDIPQFSIEKRIAMINDMAEQMARQISEQMFGALNEILNKTGQVVDQEGRPLDAEAIFSVLEKIQLDFDETGKHKDLSIVVPPELAPKAKQVLEQIHSDPTLRKRYEEIIVRKRIEWRDREAARKLVG
jgi:hypothetical protein